jgi:cytoskeletal protein CcmA (bactofilin family)
LHNPHFNAFHLIIGQLKASAQIHGEVAIGKLSIEPGANFTATCTMLTHTKDVTLKDGKGTEQKQKEQVASAH